MMNSRHSSSIPSTSQQTINIPSSSEQNSSTQLGQIGQSRSLIKTIPDGNCVFNAFALAWCKRLFTDSGLKNDKKRNTYQYSDYQQYHDKLSQDRQTYKNLELFAVNIFRSWSVDKLNTLIENLNIPHDYDKNARPTVAPFVALVIYLCRLWEDKKYDQIQRELAPALYTLAYDQAIQNIAYNSANILPDLLKSFDNFIDPDNTTDLNQQGDLHFNDSPLTLALSTLAFVKNYFHWLHMMNTDKETAINSLTNWWTTKGYAEYIKHRQKDNNIKRRDLELYELAYYLGIQQIQIRLDGELTIQINPELRTLSKEALQVTLDNRSTKSACDNIITLLEQQKIIAQQNNDSNFYTLQQPLRNIKARLRGREKTNSDEMNASLKDKKLTAQQKAAVRRLSTGEAFAKLFTYLDDFTEEELAGTSISNDDFPQFML